MFHQEYIAVLSGWGGIYPMGSGSQAADSGNLRNISRVLVFKLGGKAALGSGVQEIRIRDAAGAFRVIFVAKFAAAIYVLHCFEKKTQKISKTDLDLAEKRYRDLTKELAP
jgi:phage-related protein